MLDWFLYASLHIPLAEYRLNVSCVLKVAYTGNNANQSV